jgi:hypothetical protein
LLGIHGGEVLERVVQGHYVYIYFLGKLSRVVERQPVVAPTTFGGTMAPCIVHQDLPHDLSRDREEVGPILPSGNVLPNQAYIGLIHERGALQGVAGTLPLEIVMGNAA